jgi:type IV pilus assembly protein PilB
MKFKESYVEELYKHFLDNENNQELITFWTENIAQTYWAVPFAFMEDTLFVLMESTDNIIMLDDLTIIANSTIFPFKVSHEEIKLALTKVYHLQELQQEHIDFVREQDDGYLAKNPIVQTIDYIIGKALQEKASDIHFDPLEKEVKIRIRVDGELKELHSFSKTFYHTIISRLKIMSSLNITEKRLPQDGRINFNFENRRYELRVAVIPTVLGEKIVLRILNNKEFLTNLDAIGLDYSIAQKFRTMLGATSGLIVISGPTGSGKTTTLYSILKEIGENQKNIVTIEDPVELIIPGVNQVQVNQKVGLTFAAGLRALLRHDPDVIMIGEIRDIETAKIAVSAATSGHLVLTSIHTYDTAGTIIRLLDMGIEPYLMASSLLAVLSQRLVRKTCPNCLAGSSSECPLCNGVGYKGRMLISEYLELNEGIRGLIMQKAESTKIKNMAIQAGMRTLREDGLLKIEKNITSLKEVNRIFYLE